MAMNVMKSGLRVDAWQGEFEHGKKPEGKTDLTKVLPRIDYWLTAQPWTDLASVTGGSFYMQWTGYLKIEKPGDYEFSLGSSDYAELQWYHPKSETWATYKHDGAGKFSYSSTEDYTPETTRALEAGYHSFRVGFWHKQADAPKGVVLKVKGPDFGRWRAIPAYALTPDLPSCLAPGTAEAAACKEGYVIPAGGWCTVAPSSKCGPEQVAFPAKVQCIVNGLSTSLDKFQCVWDEEAHAEAAAKAQSELAAKANAPKEEPPPAVEYSDAAHWR
jgi:hypothetical protein